MSQPIKDHVASNTLLSELTTGVDSTASGKHRNREWHRNVFFYFVIVLFLLMLLLLCYGLQIPFSHLSRDPLAITQGEPYYGILSNIGILFWCSTFSICAFSWFILRNNPSSISVARFLKFSAALTLLLLTDDLFMLHENVFPDILGVRQRYILGFYLAATLIYVVWFRNNLFKMYSGFLITAFVFFALSLSVDLLHYSPSTWSYFLEDGAKFLGVVSWFNYFLLVCRAELIQHFCQEPKTAIQGAWL